MYAGSIVVVIISTLFLIDSIKDIKKNYPAKHPKYGKGELWAPVWIFFIVAAICKAIYISL